jgi:Protein of unknown function (DUF3224)
VYEEADGVQLQTVNVDVVPGSGTGDLAGISGTGERAYTFDCDVV